MRSQETHSRVEPLVADERPIRVEVLTQHAASWSGLVRCVLPRHQPTVAMIQLRTMRFSRPDDTPGDLSVPDGFMYPRPNEVAILIGSYEAP